MAKPVEQPNAVALLEESAHVLRRAPLDALLCYWVGSVPFALGMLLVWNDLANNHTSDSTCAAEALLLSFLLIWMNCWRSVFAGRIHRLLTGAADPPWNGQRVWRVIANQAFLGAVKLILLPVSLLAVFPFATSIAFFRNAVVLGDRSDLEPMQLIAMARRLARIDRFQVWILQFLLIVLGFITFANTAVTFIVLPGLLKMLTGYESVFSRSGSNFFTNRLFLLFAIAATWLIFDPFVQTVYCLRCFQGESVETGEDLRAGLRRIRAAATKGAVAALLILSLLAVPIHSLWAADAVPPGDLERAVRQAMQQPDYGWRIPPPPEKESDQPWIIRATDRAMEAI